MFRCRACRSIAIASVVLTARNFIVGMTSVIPSQLLMITMAIALTVRRLPGGDRYPSFALLKGT